MWRMLCQQKQEKSEATLRKKSQTLKVNRYKSKSKLDFKRLMQKKF